MNYHIIIAKCLQATNTRPSRIKLFSGRYGDSVILPFMSNSMTDDSMNYLSEKGFNIIGKG